MLFVLANKQQAGEIFKRMKISTLVQLIIQVAEINSLENPKNDEFCKRKFSNFLLVKTPILDSASQRTLTDTNRPDTQDSQMSIASSRSTLQR